MASPGELWTGYFYPETFDPARNEGTLRNLLGERDPELLASKEYARAGRRQRELLTGDVDVPRTFDAEHLRGIHRHLFQDVYEWAGQFRTVPIYKAQGAGFASVGDGTVDRLLRDAHRLVEAAPWARLDRDGFAERAADVFAHVNQAHPFREGNGRTAKVFMEHVAEQSRFTLDYDRVSPEQWNSASMMSGPDLHDYKPVPDFLVPVFRVIAADRCPEQPTGPSPDGPAPRTPGGALRDRGPVGASFPTPAGDATRKTPRSAPQARRSGSTNHGRSQGTERD